MAETQIDFNARAELKKMAFIKNERVQEPCGALS